MPKTISDEAKEAVVAAVKGGMTVSEAMKEFGVSQASLHRWMRGEYIGKKPKEAPQRVVVRRMRTEPEKPVATPPRGEVLTDREAMNAICGIIEPMDRPTRSRVLKAVHLVLNTLEADEDAPKTVAQLRPTVAQP